MRNFIKRALTRRISVEGRRRQIEVEPSNKLVYGIYFAVVALIALTAMEIVYILYIGSFSTDIFAAITLVIGTILGAFFGQKG